jgi:hypothetical protein
MVYNTANISDVTPGYYFWNGSAWIRLLACTDVPCNLINVGPNQRFTTIAEVISYLAGNMTGPTVVQLGGGTFSIPSTQTIHLSYPVTIEGLSFGETEVVCPEGTIAIDAQTECYFKMLMFMGTSSSTAIRLSGQETYYEVKDCNFSAFSKGVEITNNAEVWLFETDFVNCGASGAEVAAGSASGQILKVSECDFNGCANGINLASGTNGVVSILNCTFYNSTGTNVGLNYIPASYTNFSSIFFTNNSWNNTGSFTSGFDFARSDGRDAKAFLQNNAGMEDKNPHVKINVVDNSTSTSCNSTNTWYKANFTNTSSIPCKWTVANNRITYQPVNKRDVVMMITGNITSTAGTNRNLSVGIVKNNTSGTTTTSNIYGQVTIRVSSTSGYFPFSTVVYLEDIQAGDHFEIFVNSSSGNDAVTISDLNWWTDSK